MYMLDSVITAIISSLYCIQAVFVGLCRYLWTTGNIPSAT